MEWAEQFGLAIPEIVDFKATFGRGVEGTLVAEFRAVESVKMTALRRYFMPENRTTPQMALARQRNRTRWREIQYRVPVA